MGDFLEDLLARRLTDRENIVARAEELGCELRGGASVLVARARPHQPEEGDWRARVLVAAERGVRAVERRSLAALAAAASPRQGDRPRESGGHAERELVIVAPGEDGRAGRRAATAVLRELEASLPGYSITVSRSRHAGDPADLHRAGNEALLAANVAEARGLAELSFEETGAYRLLLPAMSEDPELHGFFDETRPARLIRRSVRDGAGAPSRRSSTATATSPGRPRSCSLIAIRSDTGSSGSAS